MIVQPASAGVRASREGKRQRSFPSRSSSTSRGPSIPGRREGGLAKGTKGAKGWKQRGLPSRSSPTSRGTSIPGRREGGSRRGRRARRVGSKEVFLRVLRPLRETIQFRTNVRGAREVDEEREGVEVERFPSRTSPTSRDSSVPSRRQGSSRRGRRARRVGSKEVFLRVLRSLREALRFRAGVRGGSRRGRRARRVGSKEVFLRVLRPLRETRQSLDFNSGAAHTALRSHGRVGRRACCFPFFS
jgi:ribosomal protein L19E